MKIYLVNEVLTCYSYDTPEDTVEKVKIKDNSVFINGKEKIPIFRTVESWGFSIDLIDKKELTQITDPEWFCPICFEQKEEAIVPVCGCK